LWSGGKWLLASAARAKTVGLFFNSLADGAVRSLVCARTPMVPQRHRSAADRPYKELSGA